ncbi:MAG: nucleoside triphosphate pyrophosphohydrolase, partial [Rhodospirillaceae bacterium]|nr:nucleoside triphosphate pyrophosphohydrolase [Rhodospirillaceae bacterium]
MSSVPPHVPAPSRPGQSLKDIHELLAIMARLRTDPGGCPWDIAQTFATVAPYTIEEAYEVADAISRSDLAGLKDELGDLLFQVVFHARMAEEAGAFRFSDVVEAICSKMIRRHPHVFGEASIPDAAAQTVAWENLKAQERAAAHQAARAKAEAAGEAPAPASVLDNLPEGLPALKQAEKFQRRAARVGFDWTDAKDVIGKIHEELEEVAAEFAAANLGQEGATTELTDEIGDLLF